MIYISPDMATDQGGPGTGTAPESNRQVFSVKRASFNRSQAPPLDTHGLVDSNDHGLPPIICTGYYSGQIHMAPLISGGKISQTCLILVFKKDQKVV